MKLELNGIYKLYTERPNTDTLTIGCYNGIPSITVFAKGIEGPAFRLPLNNALIMAIKTVLKKIIEGGPNVRTSIQKNRWDSNAKRMESDGVLVFGKDEKNIIYIDVSGANLKTPVRFNFMMPKSVSVGSDNMDDATRSRLDATAFVEEFLDKQLPIAIIMSRDAESMKAAANKRSGGRASFNKNASASPAPSEADEASIFY
jgi:hypothetical protein